jgi:elongation factor P
MPPVILSGTKNLYDSAGTRSLNNITNKLNNIMLNHNELKKGIIFILNNQPHEVLSHSLMFKGRGSSVMQTKLKNLITGNTIAKTFHQGDIFEEADLQKIKLVFIYANKNKYVFHEQNNKSKRVEISKEQIGDSAEFLKTNEIVDGLIFNEKIINILLPIKTTLKVIEAPPNIKGNRAEAGMKQVVLETGAKINAPLFIKQGDIIEINTSTGEYVRRIEQN